LQKKKKEFPKNEIGKVTWGGGSDNVGFTIVPRGYGAYKHKETISLYDRIAIKSNIAIRHRRTKENGRGLNSGCSGRSFSRKKRG